MTGWLELRFPCKAISFLRGLREAVPYQPLQFAFIELLTRHALLSKVCLVIEPDIDDSCLSDYISIRRHMYNPGRNADPDQVCYRHRCRSAFPTVTPHVADKAQQLRKVCMYWENYSNGRKEVGGQPSFLERESIQGPFATSWTIYCHAG